MKRVLFIGSHIFSIHKNVTLRGVIKPHQQIQDRGLSASGGANESQGAPLLHGKADIREGLLPLLTDELPVLRMGAVME